MRESTSMHQNGEVKSVAIRDDFLIFLHNSLEERMIDADRFLLIFVE